jgi:hydroxyethylthiazole kinase-like uncharacterized protein yjeF
MQLFDSREIKKLHKPVHDSKGEDNGQVTIIGGSQLFHGAPLLSLKVASRIVDMVFFASPEKSVGHIAEQIKSELLSFIWVPWEDVEDYIAKSDAVLIGPGFMRFSSEKIDHDARHSKCDQACQMTRDVTGRLLKKFPGKHWVIDAGSLQTMDVDWIPSKAILTPNKREFEMLFGNEIRKTQVARRDTQDASRKTKNNSRIASHISRIAKRYDCTIVLKGPETIVVSPDDAVLVKGGNPGLTKGGTGDVLAGLTTALLAKNDPVLAASAASHIAKYAADELYKKVGVNYNADDLANKIPQTFNKLLQ